MSEHDRYEHTSAYEDDPVISYLKEAHNRWKRDKWIAWNGGKQPVPDHSEVEIRYRDGSEIYGDADCFVWFSRLTDPQPIDIVGYRIIENEPMSKK